MKKVDPSLVGKAMIPAGRKKEVGTFIVTSERVRFIWASNTAAVIMFFSVESPCSAQFVAKDAEEANK